jgi:hypothetical protein
MIALIIQNYDEAARWKELVNKFGTADLQENRQQEDQKVKLHSLEERIQTTKQNLAEIHAKWSDKMAEFEFEKRAKYGEMQFRHEQELLEFRQHWNAASTLMTFAKPSTQFNHHSQATTIGGVSR